MSRDRRYRDARRRLLVDMHIPDWDDAFLADYDPRRLVEEVAATGADGAMLYFQSHVGLCYYPTQFGQRHRAMGARDWAEEALAAFAERDIPVCAYYSVNFNNRAWLDHPEWRLMPAAPAAIGLLPRERYGIVCLNNPEYRDFIDAQIAEIATYAVDAFFFDMVWWNGVCTCPSCRQRYSAETGQPIPEVVDWTTPDWTEFQRTREQWLAEFAIALRGKVQQEKPGTDVYHNFALGLSNWTRGVSFDSVAGHDFLGGDFYGGRAEQLLITRLMLNLTPNRPAEFMTTAAVNLTEHTGLRPQGQIETKALAAVVADAAFLAIVAIDPDGTIDAEAMDRVRGAFDANAALDGLITGRPIEEVALYCGDASKTNVWEPARSLHEAPVSSLPNYPHFTALAGAARALQEAHIPFGVISRANLAETQRWPMIVLPNVERLSDDEVDALRAYVVGGGLLYASRGTSLWDADNGKRPDFALADVFGCHFDGVEQARLIYATAGALQLPPRPLAHWLDAAGMRGCVKLTAVDAAPLVELTLAFGHPHKGAVEDEHWASIHSSPPWSRTGQPLVVEKSTGAGKAVYSAFDIESGDSPEHRALFVALVERMLEGRSRVRAKVHPQVWLSAFEQEDRIVVLLLNYPAEEPPLPVPGARVEVSLPPGRGCARVLAGNSGEAVEHVATASGVAVECGAFERIIALVFELEEADGE
jgi:hypothetical protein